MPGPLFHVATAMRVFTAAMSASHTVIMRKFDLEELFANPANTVQSFLLLLQEALKASDGSLLALSDNVLCFPLDVNDVVVQGVAGAIEMFDKINQATLGYGYGISVTPLQLAQAYSVLGNGGRAQPVSLVALEHPGDGAQVIDADTAAAVKRMLEEVVRPGGTGTKAAITGYRVAGKTGTAWKSGIGGYSRDKYFSIFAGFAPASDPRLAAVVVIDEPGGELYYGSDVAAPVFADVMAESLRLLAVPPDALPARDPGSVMQAMSQQAAGR